MIDIGIVRSLKNIRLNRPWQHNLLSIAQANENTNYNFIPLPMLKNGKKERVKEIDGVGWQNACAKSNCIKHRYINTHALATMQFIHPRMNRIISIIVEIIETKCET